MYCDIKDITEILESYLDVESEEDAKGFFDDLDYALKHCSKVKSTFSKRRALQAWRLVSKRVSDINRDSEESFANVGLKYRELPSPHLEVGLYTDGTFEPYVEFTFSY